MKNSTSYDSLNVIFYCIQYSYLMKIEVETDMKVFEKLINFDIPIIFIINKTPYNPYKKSSNQKIEKKRKMHRNLIINQY